MGQKLELELPEATLRKLRAVAVLSGRDLNQITEHLASEIDLALTRECATLLGLEPSGGEVGAVPHAPAEEFSPTTDPAPEGSEHVLSDDVDAQENPSLEEVVAPRRSDGFVSLEKAANGNPIPAVDPEVDGELAGPFQIRARIPEAQDADDYALAALGAPPGDPTPVRQPAVSLDGASPAQTSMPVRRPRVTVSDSDDGNPTRWFQPPAVR